MTGARRIAFAVAFGLCAASSNDAAQTVFPGRDWQEATPESQGVDSAKLKAAADALGVKQLVIVPTATSSGKEWMPTPTTKSTRLRRSLRALASASRLMTGSAGLTIRW